MDFFDLLILALIALPAIFKWLGDQAKKGQPQGPGSPEPRDESRDAEESDFERALREIGLALGGQEPEPVVVEPEPRTTHHAPRPSQKDPGGFSREEAFEDRSEEFHPPVEAAPFRRLRLARIEAPEVEEVAAAPAADQSTARTLLRSASNARRAFLLSEVLGKPLAFRDPLSDQPAG